MAPSTESGALAFVRRQRDILGLQMEALEREDLGRAQVLQGQFQAGLASLGHIIRSARSRDGDRLPETQDILSLADEMRALTGEAEACLIRSRSRALEVMAELRRSGEALGRYKSGKAGERRVEMVG
ncbi:MAG: hypothetical protein FJY67_02750 [Calditrichaeota bacterium]|nr:hypothetical protein [Calditrichota bacterium]